MQDEDLPWNFPRDWKLGEYLPNNWTFGEHQWLVYTPWFRRTFPRFGVARARLLACIQAHLSATPQFADSICAIVGHVLSEASGVDTYSLSVLESALAKIRGESDTVVLQVVHFLIAALSTHSGLLDSNPVAFAMRAVGWTRVPPACTGVVVELTLTLLLWHDTKMRDSCEIRHDAPRISFEDLVLHLNALVAAAAIEAGLVPPEGWWAMHESCTPNRGFSYLDVDTLYFWGVIRGIAPDDPLILALYEAYSDRCEPPEMLQVEAAALVLARRPGQREGDSLLRSALRAWMRGDIGCAVSRAEAAFACIPALDGAGRGFAAALAGLLRVRHEPWGARAWLTVASELHRGCERPVCERFLEHLAGLADELGSHEEAQRLRAKLAGYPRPKAVRKTTVSTRADGRVAALKISLHADFNVNDVMTHLATGDLRSAGRCYSERVGELLEDHGLAGATAILAICYGICEETMRCEETSYVGPGDWGMISTLTSWTCAALAELHSLGRDLVAWSRFKNYQLDLEDNHKAAPEIGGDHGVQTPIRCSLDPHTRLLQCTEEAETAFAAGAMDQARFWTKRAQYYRMLTRTCFGSAGT